MSQDGVLVIGVGYVSRFALLIHRGPTSSGKTTVVQNLLALLRPAQDAPEPDPIRSVHILHQDDFCPPKDQMPWNEKWKVTDWDTPHGSSDYRRLEGVIEYFRQHARLPSDFESHEYRRSDYDCTLSPAVLKQWRDKFHAPRTSPLLVTRDGQLASHVHILIVEGFLTFFDTRVSNLLQVRLFLRVSKHLIKKRRDERANYVLEDGEVWVDPPFYFDEIVWPAYLEAHARMFANGDVEKGAPIETTSRDSDGGPVPHLTLIEAEDRGTEAVVQDACNAIYTFAWKQ